MFTNVVVRKLLKYSIKQIINHIFFNKFLNLNIIRLSQNIFHSASPPLSTCVQNSGK